MATATATAPTNKFQPKQVASYVATTLAPDIKSGVLNIDAKGRKTPLIYDSQQIIGNMSLNNRWIVKEFRHLYNPSTGGPATNEDKARYTPLKDQLVEIRYYKNCMTIIKAEQQNVDERNIEAKTIDFDASGQLEDNSNSRLLQLFLYLLPVNERNKSDYPAYLTLFKEFVEQDVFDETLEMKKVAADVLPEFLKEVSNGKMTFCSYVLTKFHLSTDGQPIDATYILERYNELNAKINANPDIYKLAKSSFKEHVFEMLKSLYDQQIIFFDENNKPYKKDGSTKLVFPGAVAYDGDIKEKITQLAADLIDSQEQNLATISSMYFKTKNN